MENKYRLHIDEMDDQQTRIFYIADPAKSAELNDSEMQAVIVELLEYAKFHLEEEEKMLTSHGLSDFLTEHIKLHTKFRERAMDLYQMYREAESTQQRRDLLKDTATFCESWLLKHIDIEDRKYAALLKGRTR